ncbi:hypothetical protein, partial [Thiolapillus sp.]|uniref:hypothetical protein n=1 Tax=Thiolapillus sp. TaxID=2017437 RepID=UPI003AF55B97
MHTAIRPQQRVLDTWLGTSLCISKTSGRRYQRTVSATCANPETRSEADALICVEYRLPVRTGDLETAASGRTAYSL